MMTWLDRRVPPVSEEKGKKGVPVRDCSPGPWAGFSLGPKCCPAAFLIFFDLFCFHLKTLQINHF
jgi:hypothetical protein